MMIISDHLLVMKQATILIVVVLSMHVCLRNGYISRGNRPIDAMLLFQLNCRHESARIAASHDERAPLQCHSFWLQLMAVGLLFKIL